MNELFQMQIYSYVPKNSKSTSSNYVNKIIWTYGKSLQAICLVKDELTYRDMKNGRHLQSTFWNTYFWKESWCFEWNLNEVCPCVSNGRYASTSLYNGSVPNLMSHSITGSKYQAVRCNNYALAFPNGLMERLWVLCRNILKNDPLTPRRFKKN